MSDSLFNSAEFYKNNLLNKSFYLRAGNKKHELVEFNIIFKEEHFKHLIGINKLNDLPYSNMSGEDLLNIILNKSLTKKILQESESFSEIENRIEYFQEISNCIFAKKIMQ